MTTEYRPWAGGGEKDIKKALPTRKTFDTSEGLAAIRGVRERMGEVLKKDNALKVSMYIPTKIKRKDGDTWTDHDGKEWEMKGDIAQSIPKLQGAKIPFWCTKCSKTMKRLDMKMWYKRGVCFDCILKEEGEARANGTFAEYERQIMYANAISMVKDKLDEFKSWKKDISNPELHFSDGRFETWNVGTAQIKEDIQEEINQLEDWLVELQKEAKD